MKCCINCFYDKDIRERITSLNNRSDCDLCGTRETNVLELNNIEESSIQNNIIKNIVSDFDNLLSEFTNNFDEKYSNYAHKLSDYLEKYTNIFAIPEDDISKFLKSLFPSLYKENPSLFNSVVVPTYLLNPEKVETNGIFKGHSWDEFKKDIQYNNRFHSTMVNDNILLDFFRDCSVTRSGKTRLYRARVSDKGSIFTPEEMWAAPNGIASAGRLNASGIGYLYLCEDSNTPLQEVKSSVNDICTVAVFEIREEQSLCLTDLSQLSNISVFTSPDLTRYLMNQKILQDIDKSMGETSNKNRSDIDYAPTEYMSDLIKSTGVDGIMYKSTLDKDVNNVVLFNGLQSNNKISQLTSEIKTYKIKNISYRTNIFRE